MHIICLPANPLFISVDFFLIRARRNSFAVGEEQARITNVAFTLNNGRFFAEVVVTFGPGRGSQTDCDDDDDNNNDDDGNDEDGDIFFDEIYEDIWNRSDFLIFLWDLLDCTEWSPIYRLQQSRT
jgi:hypothetical protein